MPHTDADLDRMLAEHDERFGKYNEALLTGRPPNGDRPEAGDEPVQEPPAQGYGPEPRKDWPRLAKKWTPELVAERNYWVRKFVGDQGDNFEAAAVKIGVHPTTIARDARLLGLVAPPATPDQTVVRLRLGERREEVRRLFEANLGVEEIAEQLGVHMTTVRSDLRALKLVRPKDRVANQKAITMVSRALTGMDDMAQLLLNLPELEILQVDEEQVQAWLKQLRRIARATSRVRKTTKGT